MLVALCDEFCRAQYHLSGKPLSFFFKTAEVIFVKSDSQLREDVASISLDGEKHKIYQMDAEHLLYYNAETLKILVRIITILDNDSKHTTTE